MRQQDLLLAGDPASTERSRERALRKTPGIGGNFAPHDGEIVNLSARLTANERDQLPGTHDGVLAERILRTFNTWAFKREQPSDAGLMIESISHAIKQGEPLS